MIIVQGSAKFLTFHKERRRPFKDSNFQQITIHTNLLCFTFILRDGSEQWALPNLTAIWQILREEIADRDSNLTAIWQILREEIADRDREKTVLKREKRDKDTQLLNLQLEYFAEERKSQIFHAKYLSDITEKGSSAINKALMKTNDPSQQRVMATKTTTRQ